MLGSSGWKALQDRGFLRLGDSLGWGTLQDGWFFRMGLGIPRMGGSLGLGDSQDGRLFQDAVVFSVWAAFSGCGGFSGWETS